MQEVLIKTVSLVAIITSTCGRNPLTFNYEKKTNKSRFTETGGFSEYMKKFSPVTVMENINKIQKKNGRNFTRREYFDMAFDKLDPTDELLKIKIENGNAKILGAKTGRRWIPPKGLAAYPKDRFSLRQRFYELMRQAVYQARNKMVFMQMMRDKYRKKPMYKMGYLTSKTDNACKIFAQVAFRAIRSCSGVRTRSFQMSLYDLLVIQQVLLFRWFEVDLLKDLVINNDEKLHEVYEFKQRWNFTD